MTLTHQELEVRNKVVIGTQVAACRCWIECCESVVENLDETAFAIELEVSAILLEILECSFGELQQLEGLYHQLRYCTVL